MRWDDWIHAILGTHGSWLPGDPRGFRDHDHRVHSSGDYRNPPPPGEHAALLQRSLQLCPTAITIPTDLRRTVADALAAKLLGLNCPPRVLCVAGRHAHMLMRVGEADAKPIIGRAKQFASHHVRAELPGTIWAQGCHVVRVRDEEHYRNVTRYIENHAREGGALWVHPDLRGIHPDLRKASGPASGTM